MTSTATFVCSNYDCVRGICSSVAHRQGTFVIADSAVYVNGFRRPGHLEISEAFEAGREPGAFVWVDLVDPSPEEFVAVEQELQLHPLAVEDTTRAHQRPKMDVFDETVFIVLKSALYNDIAESVETGEIHVFAGDGFVVSVAHHDALSLTEVRRKLEENPHKMAFGPGSVLYAITDHVVDEYQQVMDGVENDIDELETQVFSSRQNSAERIFRLKRQVLDFQRSVLGIQDVLEPLTRQQVPSSCRHDELPAYFRDVHDHALRVASRVTIASETLKAALDANLAQVSVRQNEDMRAMSGWAAVIAVPTLFAGVWGMNFQYMPELDQRWGYPFALVTIFGSGAAIRWRLKRSGWL
jgi:magnesium transporter